MNRLDERDRASGDTAGVVTALRAAILDGRCAAGQPMAEIPLARSLGVSRTPVRLALRTLAQEGLLAKRGARGYAVRAFSEADVRAAVEVRGVLEGLAARRLAEQGLAPALRDALHDCLAEGERVLGRARLAAEDIGDWAAMNRRFHRAIAEGGDSHVVADAIARNNALPFASSDSIAIDETAPAREHERLRVAQLQHRLIVEALEQRESARVELLMREHANIGLRYARHLARGG